MFFIESKASNQLKF